MVEATEEWIARNKGEAYQSRRSRPSFSSALLEAISRSTESTQEQRSRTTRPEMDKKYHYRDSTLGRPNESHAKRGSEEILIFQARKYFNGSYESRPPYSLQEEDEEDDDTKEDPEKEHFGFKSDSCSDTSTVKGLSTPTWPFSESAHGRRGSRPFRKSADDYLADRRNYCTSPAVVVGVGGHGSGRSSASQGVAMKELLMKKEKPQPKPKEATTDAKKQRPKQPMSPGSKLASFLNSLFTPTSTKRNSQRVDPRVPKSDEGSGSGSGSGSTYSAKSRIKKEKEASHSVCSRSSSTKSMSTITTPSVASVASVSKSSYLCDIYKPKSKSDDRGGTYTRYDSSSFQNTKLKSSCVSSAKKENNGKNGRSVTFHPTSLILDENARPCGEKDLNRVENPKRYNHHSSLMARKLRLQLLDKGVIPSECLLHGKHSSHKVGDSNSRVFEEEDDAASDSSSDLFELENFNAMDMNIYSRDLPVYETTHLETNKAIAKGLL